MFNKKTWKDTIAEYPNRRTLTDAVTGATQTVNVTREVGTISQEGDAWSSANMNDLENRIENAFKGLLTATIPIGETSVTIEDASITEDSIIDIYFENKVLSPTAVTVSNGSITIMIEEEESATNVGVRCL